ncbi:hypothetical protein N9917_02355 [Deltaproteobacteria bacterium]|nr:hypothetical protein [Deltaproteobacteria bacterium]
MTSRDGLLINLKDLLHLPDLACDWLLLVYDAIQVFDDVADNDTVDKQDLNATIYNMFVGQYRNQFFAVNSLTLIPLIEVAILKWHAANKIEKEQKAGPISFVWRASYYDIVLMVVNICKGKEFAEKNAHLVAMIYGEKYTDYLEEFINA